MTLVLMGQLALQCTWDSLNDNETNEAFNISLQILFGLTGCTCMLCLYLLIRIIQRSFKDDLRRE